MMRSALRSLELARIDIPFRLRFAHASAERDRTESVLVVATTAAGAIGAGEGCPRSYVTGEDRTSVERFFDAHADAILEEVCDSESLRGFVESRRAEIDAHPAAWCAIELALLDVLAREREQSVEAALGLPELTGSFQYTAVLGDSEPDAFERLLGLYRAAGFRDFKLKLSGELGRDRAKLASFRDRPDERVRVDANNLWPDADTASRHLEALAHPFTGIEEPIAAGRFDELAALADRMGTPIILDESLLRAETIAKLPGPSEHWIANLRVSKLGGLLRSLEVAREARRSGVRIVVGAQVGETSLLTRAALPVARAAGHLLVGQEGAFGPLLLERDPCAAPLVFGDGGRLEAPTTGVGLGLSIIDDDAWSTTLRRASR